MTGLPEIFSKWSMAMDAIDAAVGARDYQALMAALSHGDECFQEISSLIQGGRKQELLDVRGDLEQIIERWRQIPEAIAPWMGEIRVEIDGIRKKRRLGNQLGKNFRYRSSSGIRLSVKAR